MNEVKQIVGRYAPSPTGDQHLGNLRSALLAWLHARLQNGRFLVRMEDLDRPREVAGSADQILRDLEWLGLDWDGPIVYQSQRQEHYEEALQKLQAQDLIYACFCSRKDIANAVSAPHFSAGVYPQTCKNLSSTQLAQKRQEKQPSLRVTVDHHPVVFIDACQGQQQEILSEKVGDFVMQRADGLFSYQLAVVVDDLEQGVTDVVRGDDLLSSTARQYYLAQKLGTSISQLNYCHVPLMFDDEGERMSKRFGSTTARYWRDEGGRVEQLVGNLAASIGLRSTAEPISAEELRQSLSFESLMNTIRSAKTECL